MNRTITKTLALALAACAAPALASNPTQLFAWDSFNDTLYAVDVPSASASLITTGAQPYDPIISEIEYAGGFFYGSDTGDNTILDIIDPGSGLIIDTISMTFPPEGNVITAMEEIDGTVYAGLTTEGSGGESYLTTINTATGAITVVGDTGITVPLGGLAYNGRTLYAVTSGGSTPLYTVNLTSGAATLVGTVTVGATSPGLTALEFTEDGSLYALPNFQSASVNHLLWVNPATAIAVDLGEVVSPASARLVSLTSTFLPTPSSPSCNLADVAEPYGLLDLADVVGFVQAFTGGCP